LAFPKLLSVIIPACHPVNATLLYPLDFKAVDIITDEITSPHEISKSRSLEVDSVLQDLENFISVSVA